MREEWLDLGAQVSMTFTFPGGLCAALEGVHPFTPNSEGPSAGGQTERWTHLLLCSLRLLGITG